jgi:tRNA-specific adenosine deaminase 3
MPAFVENSLPVLLHAVTVPTYSPTSAAQAEQWTKDYWPVLYKNTNPFGPHPSIISKNEEELNPVAGSYLALAQLVAEHAHQANYGVECGCIIVDNSSGVYGKTNIIAVAGDARWCNTGFYQPADKHSEHVAGHAVMRAIGMVARKRVRVAQNDQETVENEHSDSVPHIRVVDSVDQILTDLPVSSTEHYFFGIDNLLPNGYLCTDLDIYLTHEPCVMCSMAILHSRFKRCIFAKRMPQTGGMCSDSGLCHGIFWRPSELNWKLLAWEWVRGSKTKDESSEDFVGSDETGFNGSKPNRQDMISTRDTVQDHFLFA